MVYGRKDLGEDFEDPRYQLGCRCGDKRWSSCYGGHPGGLLGLFHQLIRTGGPGAHGPDGPQEDGEADDPQLTAAVHDR